MAKILWRPTDEQIQKTQMHQFRQKVAAHIGRAFESYKSFYQWSVADLEGFWGLWLENSGLLYEGETAPVLRTAGPMYERRYFPKVRLNYAENLLSQLRAEEEAVVFWAEDQLKESWTMGQLKAAVWQAQQALLQAQLQAGDRVAAYVANTPEALVWMLATASLGGVWCSCSQDFGVQGALDRFAQIAPKIFIATDGALYKGNALPSWEKVAALAAQLPTVTMRVWLPYLESRGINTCSQANGSSSPAPGWLVWNALKARETEPHGPLQFLRFSFDHPLFILFSSGTTGLPKCIVHGAGGTLLQHLKEHKLHCDILPGDRLFYYTTTGWMMWNWQVSALAAGATLLLYDGAPLSPRVDTLFAYAQEAGCTHFGTSAKFVDALRANSLNITEQYALQALRMVTSTGSPLVAESFEYLYTHVKKDMCVASISGGTDIISCFALGNPTTPVYAGELQTPGLGMAVEIFDDAGQPLEAEKGELVCTKPFPTMPIKFWDDPGHKKYIAAYFSKFANIWCHGDFAGRTPTGGLIIYGRSDATLNPGGVRIGTAEIYRQVEQLAQIEEALVVGRQGKDDVEVVLFVKLKPDITLDQEHIKIIKSLLRENASPRHVPAEIHQVPDIPKTKNGKLVEMAVWAVLQGKPVQNQASLANPEALTYFERFR